MYYTYTPPRRGNAAYNGYITHAPRRGDDGEVVEHRNVAGAMTTRDGVSYPVIVSKTGIRPKGGGKQVPYFHKENHTTVAFCRVGSKGWGIIIRKDRRPLLKDERGFLQNPSFELRYFGTKAEALKAFLKMRDEMTPPTKLKAETYTDEDKYPRVASTGPVSWDGKLGNYLRFSKRGVKSGAR